MQSMKLIIQTLINQHIIQYIDGMSKITHCIIKSTFKNLQL